MGGGLAASHLDNKVDSALHPNGDKIDVHCKSRAAQERPGHPAML